MNTGINQTAMIYLMTLCQIGPDALYILVIQLGVFILFLLLICLLNFSVSSQMRHIAHQIHSYHPPSRHQEPMMSSDNVFSLPCPMARYFAPRTTEPFERAVVLGVIYTSRMYTTF